jgi:hypothetical protein
MPKQLVAIVSILMMILIPIAITPQTIDNGITLYVTKVSNKRYHLQWEDPNGPNCWELYYVYASQDPKVLGDLVATVRDTQVDLRERQQTDILWFFQVVRAHG